MNHLYVACNQCLKILLYIIFLLQLGHPDVCHFYGKRSSEGYWDLLVILSYRNELTPTKSFVIIQAMPHRPFWVGSWSFLKKYNNIPSLYMYRFIINTCHISHICTYLCFGTKCVQFGSKVCVFCSQSGSKNPPASDILNKS